MTDTINDQALEGQTTSPECYVRINVSKTTTGYSYETTVSLRWENEVIGAEYLALRPGGFAGEPEPAAVLLQQLLESSDALAREEIARRQIEDEE